MQKHKKVSKTTSARQPAIRTKDEPALQPKPVTPAKSGKSAKSGKPASQSRSSVSSQPANPAKRVRKPLTQEQRNRKNERARAAYRARHCTYLAKNSPHSVRHDAVSGCSRPDKCRTSTFLSGGMQAPAVPCAEGTPSSAASPICAIAEWVRSSVDRLTATRGTGIVRRVFPFCDGVAEVSVCRRACDIADGPSVTSVRSVPSVELSRQFDVPVFGVDVGHGGSASEFWILSSGPGIEFPFRRVFRGQAVRAVPAVDFGDDIVRGHARRGLTWYGEEPDPS